MTQVSFSDRGVISVSGPEAATFLNGLVTVDVTRIIEGQARFSALLTPQGKILADFFIVATPADGFLLDCPATLAPDLLKRLLFYKLRAKVEIENRTDHFQVVASWGEAASPDHGAFTDPREDALGWRAFIPSRKVTTDTFSNDTSAYHAHRIALGIPQGGLDFAYGSTFPHEALMDRLKGVDFDKGCYVGQEVVSRMQHRGTARTRIVPVAFEDGSPLPGEALMAGALRIGEMGSSASTRGLALVRVDRAAEAIQNEVPILAGDTVVRLDVSGFAVASPSKALS